MQQHDSSTASLLRDVTVLSHDSAGDRAGPYAAAALHVASPAADDCAQRPTRLLALHRAVWSSGIACVLLAAFIFAVTALLVKLTAGRVPVLEITLIRSGISLVVSGALIKAKDIKPVMGHVSNLKWLIPRGVFGATAMTTFYAAILLLPLADGMTLFFLNPCLTAIAAWVLRGEPLGLLGLAGCLCSLFGVVVVIHPPMFFGGHVNWGPSRIWGTGFGLISAICCAGAFISIRFIGKSEPAIVVALWFHTSTAILSSVPLALSWPQAAVPVGWFDALMLLGVSAGSFLGQLFMTRGLQLENASLISSLNFSQVLYSYVFGIMFFSEHLTLFGVLGSLLVALGMVCVTLRPKDDADAGAGSDAATHTAELSNSSSNALGDERTQRLNSFKRLLSRARGDASSSSDQQQQTTESVPLKHDDGSTIVAGSALGSQEELHLDLGLQRPREQRQLWMQEPAGPAACVGENALQQQQHHHQQQQHQQQHSDQVVLTATAHLPVQVAETSHSIHHRHPLHPPDHALSQTAPQQQQQQQQQLGQPGDAQLAGYHASVMLPLQPEPASGPS